MESPHNSELENSSGTTTHLKEREQQLGVQPSNVEQSAGEQAGNGQKEQRKQLKLKKT